MERDCNDAFEQLTGWAKEEAPFVHGYWDWDWADSIQAIVGAKSGTDGVEVTLPAGQTSKKHARFFGLNLKSGKVFTRRLAPRARC